MKFGHLLADIFGIWKRPPAEENCQKRIRVPKGEAKMQLSCSLLNSTSAMTV
jgi:hypothetical protein